MLLTTWEAAKKYKLSTGYIRVLLARGTLKGRQAPITSRRFVWLLEENSLKTFLKKVRKPGPKTKKRS